MCVRVCSCLRPSAKQRPAVVSLLQTLASHSAVPSKGLSWANGRVDDGHLAGQLTISGLKVRNLFPKSASGAVKPYILVTSGGTRRMTSVAQRGRGASWTPPIVLSTHTQRPVELTVWAAHRRRWLSSCKNVQLKSTLHYFKLRMPAGSPALDRFVLFAAHTTLWAQWSCIFQL